MRLPLALVLGVGLGLRILVFLAEYSLGLDEARLALSIAGRSYTQLTPPLDHDQSAPLLFLWAGRLSAQLFGVNELALRAVPLLAGIGTVLLAFPVFRRLLSARGALLGTGMVAFAPLLVHYASEVKQYSVEAFTTLVILKVTLDWLDAPSSNAAKFRLLGTGVIAVWMSAPAIFILAGAIGALTIVAARGGLTSRRLLAQATPIWVISFGLAYIIVYRHAAGNPYMLHFWESAFLRMDNVSSLPRIWIAVQDVMWGVALGNQPVPRTEFAFACLSGIAVVLLMLASLGAWRLLSLHGLECFILVVGALAAVLIAAAGGAYPVAPRVMVFASPLVCVLIAAGVEASLVYSGRFDGLKSWSLVSALLLTRPFLGAATEGILLDPGGHLRPVIDTLRQHRQSGEAVYVFAGSIPAWAFYSTDWDHPDTVRLALLDRVARPGGRAFENAPSRRHPVRAEDGVDLVYPTPDGPELLGVPTGMEYRAVVGLAQAAPDSGWAAHEASRIAAAGNSGVWVLMSEYYGPELDLFSELKQKGGRSTFELQGVGTRLLRFDMRPRNIAEVQPSAQKSGR